MTLPETLVVGKGCFFATGNILTSVDVDQGKFNVPCVTYMRASANDELGFFVNEMSARQFLRKPASWLVAVCERSENRGCGWEWLTKWDKISLSGWEKGAYLERFAGLCTTRQWEGHFFFGFFFA